MPPPAPHPLLLSLLLLLLSLHLKASLASPPPPQQQAHEQAYSATTASQSLNNQSSTSDTGWNPVTISNIILSVVGAVSGILALWLNRPSKPTNQFFYIESAERSEPLPAFGPDPDGRCPPRADLGLGACKSATTGSVVAVPLPSPSSSPPLRKAQHKPAPEPADSAARYAEKAAPASTTTTVIAAEADR